MMPYLRKIIIFSSVSLLTALLLIALIIIPLLGSIYNIFGQITEAKRDLASFNNEMLKAEVFDQEYSGLQITPETINQNLVAKSAPIDLIKFFEDTAKDAGLLVDISPVSVSKGNSDQWDSIGFSVELTGDFAGSMKFLEKVENSSYFIEAVKFDANVITQKDVGPQRYNEFSIGQISTVIDFKVYAKQ
jgi:hypothetical protein